MHAKICMTSNILIVLLSLSIMAKQLNQGGRDGVAMPMYRLMTG